MALNEYEGGSTFPGTIGRRTDKSSPPWPKPTRTAPGTPNVLMVVLDDTGFGHLGCYGSPIKTPTFDALAAEAPFLINPGALTCGANPGSPVTPDYPSPYRFTGTLHSITVDVVRRADHRQRQRGAGSDGPSVAPRPAGTPL
jgi:hypothetical protein